MIIIGGVPLIIAQSSELEIRLLWTLDNGQGPWRTYQVEIRAETICMGQATTTNEEQLSQPLPSPPMYPLLGGTTHSARPVSRASGPPLLGDSPS